MAEKNEIMNIMDYEVVDTRSNDIQISGTEIATQLVAVIPNAVAAPFPTHEKGTIPTRKTITAPTRMHPALQKTP